MTRPKTLKLWFWIPAALVAGAVMAISIPGLADTQEAVRADSLAIPIIAMLLLAAAVAAVVGLVMYGIRRAFGRARTAPGEA